jgi:hypothetical protein
MRPHTILHFEHALNRPIPKRLLHPSWSYTPFGHKGVIFSLANHWPKKARLYRSIESTGQSFFTCPTGLLSVRNPSLISTPSTPDRSANYYFERVLHCNILKLDFTAKSTCHHPTLITTLRNPFTVRISRPQYENYNILLGLPKSFALPVHFLQSSRQNKEAQINSTSTALDILSRLPCQKGRPLYIYMYTYNHKAYKNSTFVAH